MEIKFDNTDISKYFTWNLADAAVAKQLVEREETPEAITYFAEHCDSLSDYGYWFMLSTLWVSYTRKILGERNGWNNIMMVAWHSWLILNRGNVHSGAFGISWWRKPA